MSIGILCFPRKLKGFSPCRNDQAKSLTKLSDFSTLLRIVIKKISLDVRKPVFGVSDGVPHKPDCAATEGGKRLEISDVGSRGIVLSS